MREKNEIKQQVIVHLKDPPTNDHQLFSYQSNVHDGYDSDFTANTYNLEGTFIFLAETEYYTNASINSNGEIEGTSDLTVNATTSKNNPSAQFQYPQKCHPVHQPKC